MNNTNLKFCDRLYTLIVPSRRITMKAGIWGKAHGEKSFELILEGWPRFDYVEKEYFLMESTEA